MAVYPGKIYARKVSDAARVVQDWWWNAWPSVLRRRKSAALAIQSLYRGFAQRKLWHGIIRLRTLWGNTRITAHAFVPWRDHVAKVGRVAAFTRRFRKRCAGRCLTAWRGFVDAKIKDREDLVRRRLKRVKEGIRARVFEGWIRYSEISLAVERMRRRVCTRPVLRAWRKHAHADRVYTHLHWACATLASRVLRWRARARFVDCRRACCKIQRFARGGNARVKVQRRAAEARTRQAEEIVQIVEVGAVWLNALLVHIPLVSLPSVRMVVPSFREWWQSSANFAFLLRRHVHALVARVTRVKMRAATANSRSKPRIYRKHDFA